MDKIIKTKWFSLKRTYIFIMSISIIVAIIISTLVSTLVTSINYQSSSRSVTYSSTSDPFVTDDFTDETKYKVFTYKNGQIFTVYKGNMPKNDYSVALIRDIINLIVVSILFLICIVIATYIFYRWKLKIPLRLIKNSIDKISRKDLDFTIDYIQNDEMGLLCNAFENMRRELFVSFKEQWKAQEDRRLLNAAFAHDLRTPLTVLSGQTELLLKNVENNRADKEKITSTLKLLEKHIHKIADYTNKMSAMQRLEDMPIEKKDIVLVDFFSVCKKNLLQLANSFNKKLDFSVDIQSYALEFDETVVMRVLENVSANAFRFAYDTVSIHIKADHNILVTVTDDGPGFSKKALTRALEPFFSENQKSEPENIGLGLCICNILLKKHGGSICISNRETHGACVEIKFI